MFLIVKKNEGLKIENVERIYNLSAALRLTSQKITFFVQLPKPLTDARVSLSRSKDDLSSLHLNICKGRFISYFASWNPFEKNVIWARFTDVNTHLM